MLTVILTILKILGIIIAVLVGLILLIALLVGFVPIRYKAAVKYPEEGSLNEDVISKRKRDALKNKIKGADEKEADGEEEKEKKKELLIKANAVVSWLLHIVHVRLDLDSTGMVITARLFGIFKVYSTDPESVKKREEKRKKKEEKKRRKEEKKKLKEEKKKPKEIEKKEDSVEAAKATDNEKEKAVKEVESIKKTEETGEDKESSKSPDTASDEDDFKDFEEAFDMEEDDEKESETSDEYIGLAGKFKKIKDKFGKIKEKILSIKDKIKALNKKKDYLIQMKDNERVRRGVGYAKDKFLLILKRILPKKCTGYVAFGMDDPASTGKILGAASAFFPIWGDHFTVVPDFENKRLEVDADVRGRIMLALLVIPALKVWFNKDIKYIRRKVDKFKKM
ncbi:MAG: DUF2953 domain-containing protein [Lachnospiraceae bacterium]|nr:DUF2953 domain-containing protein [Lachnospiraceae bacterium]